VILYSVVAQIVVRRLFVSGLAPFFLEILQVSGYVFFLGKRSAVARVSFQPARALSALRGAKWELAIPLVVLGSILGGFAPSLALTLSFGLAE
jgi:TRAP-type C4-dicarboxylate transport system permease large subunit